MGMAAPMLDGGAEKSAPDTGALQGTSSALPDRQRPRSALPGRHLGHNRLKNSALSWSSVHRSGLPKSAVISSNARQRRPCQGAPSSNLPDTRRAITMKPLAASAYSMVPNSGAVRALAA